MNRIIPALGIIAILPCSSCNKEEPLSPEAEAMKLLISRDILAISDLMLFKVYDPELEVIFQAWNSDQEDGDSFTTVK